MRLSVITGLSLCLFTVLIHSGCKRMVKEDSMDVACAKSMQAATTKLEEVRAQLEKDQVQIIENLLSAAKIEQQKLHYAECDDKAQRALQLLRPHQ